MRSNSKHSEEACGANITLGNVRSLSNKVPSDALKWCRRLGLRPTDSAFRIIDNDTMFYNTLLKCDVTYIVECVEVTQDNHFVF